MNQVRAVGARARRASRAAARTDRGLPARRRRPAPFATGRLRDGWPSVSLHRASRPVGPQLIGTRQPSASLARRGRIPTGLRDLHMQQLPEVVVSRPSPGQRAGAAAGEVAATVEAPAAVETAAAEQAAAEQAAETARIDTERAAAEQLAATEAERVEAERVEAERVEAERVEAQRVEAQRVEAARVEAQRVEAQRVEAERASQPVAEPSAVPAPPTAVTAPAAVPPPPGGAVTAAPRELVALMPPPDAADQADQTDQADQADRVGPRRGRRPSRRLLAVVGAAVVVAAVGTTVGVAISQHSTTSPPAATASADTSTTAVATWLQANVPSTVTIASTDSKLATGLTASGLTVQVIPALDAAPPMSVVVTAGSPDAAAPTDPVEISASRSLVPLAVFGTGSDAVAVGQSVERPVTDIQNDQDSAADTARSASTGLLDNAAITVSADARPVFEAGRLDLRAAALLAIAAGEQPVQVATAPIDAAETVAGVPVRRVVVTVADPTRLRSVVTSSRYPYTPTVAAAPPGDQVPDGSLLLTWPILADPALTVN